MNEITKELLEELRLAVNQMELAGDCIEAGRNDEALLHLRSLPRIKREAIAKAEAALAEPQADADGWIPWSGGERPVSAGVRVDVLLRNGKKRQEEPGWLFWGHGQLDGDIIAYRIAKGADK